MFFLQSSQITREEQCIFVLALRIYSAFLKISWNYSCTYLHADVSCIRESIQCFPWQRASNAILNPTAFRTNTIFDAKRYTVDVIFPPILGFTSLLAEAKELLEKVADHKRQSWGKKCFCGGPLKEFESYRIPMNDGLNGEMMGSRGIVLTVDRDGTTTNRSCDASASDSFVTCPSRRLLFRPSRLQKTASR